MRDTVENVSVDRRFSVDTSFVLFFLAVDLGQSVLTFRIDTAMSAVALGLVLVLPYVMPTEAERPGFSGWLAGRTILAGFGIGLGMMFKQALGPVLPEMFRYMPMSLLIVSATLSCYLQFCAMIRLRLAR
jgi:hypothetical protein